MKRMLCPIIGYRSSEERMDCGHDSRRTRRFGERGVRNQEFDSV